MARSAPVRANRTGRKHNNRMWAEKRRVTRGLGAVRDTGGIAKTNRVDMSKAVYRPAPAANHNVPPGGTSIITFDGWESAELTALYHKINGPVFDGFDDDTNLNIEVSILCGLPTGTGQLLGVEVWRNAAVEQEVIRHWITQTDERHNGNLNLHVEATDTIDVRLSDPAGGGYTVTVQEVYVNFDLGNRR